MKNKKCRSLLLFSPQQTIHSSRFLYRHKCQNVKHQRKLTSSSIFLTSFSSTWDCFFFSRNPSTIFFVLLTFVPSRPSSRELGYIRYSARRNAYKNKGAFGQEGTLVSLGEASFFIQLIPPPIPSLHLHVLAIEQNSVDVERKLR